MVLLAQRAADPAWYAGHALYWASWPNIGSVFTKETFTAADLEELQDEDLVSSGAARGGQAGGGAGGRELRVPAVLSGGRGEVVARGQGGGVWWRRVRERGGRTDGPPPRLLLAFLSPVGTHLPSR